VLAPVSPRTLTLSATLLTLSACAHGPWFSPEQTRAPAPFASEERGAVNLVREKHVRFHVVDGVLVADERNRVARRLLTEAGRDAMAHAIPYSQTFDRVLDAQARLVAPDGTATVRGRDAFVDVPSVQDGIAFQDGRYVTTRFEDAPIGSVAEFHFAVRRGSPELFAFLEFFASAFGDGEVRLVVEAPAGFELEHAVSEGWRPIDWAPTRETLPDGGTRWTWARQAIAPYENEPYGVGVVDGATLVQVRVARWLIDGQVKTGPSDELAFARWVHALQGKAAEPDDAIRRVVADVLAGAPADPEARAARLYAWVQSNIRYVAIHLGLDGWRAHAARDILANRYGDCKDKATLLAAMLDVVGIPSRFVITNSHDGLPRRRLLPVIGVANNHAVLAIDLPSRTVIVDPTTETTPFGELPASEDGSEVLLAHDARPERRVLELETPAHPTRVVEVSVANPWARTVTASVSVHASGRAADALEYGLRRADDDKRRWLAWSARLGGSVVSAARATPTHPTPTGAPHRTAATGVAKLEGVGQRAGNLELVRLDRVLDDVVPALRNAARRGPLVLPGKEASAWRVRFAVPSGRDVSLPEPFEVRDADLALGVRWRRDGAAVVADVEVTPRRTVFEAGEVDGLRRRWDAMRAALARPAVIRPATAVGPTEPKQPPKAPRVGAR
jgi:hypothetical protein